MGEADDDDAGMLLFQYTACRANQLLCEVMRLCRSRLSCASCESSTQSPRHSFTELLLVRPRVCENMGTDDTGQFSWCQAAVHAEDATNSDLQMRDDGVGCAKKKEKSYNNNMNKNAVKKNNKHTFEKARTRTQTKI